VKTKFVPQSRMGKPWFTDELRRLCNIKHELFRKYRSNEVSFSAYNTFKNKFTKILKKKKIEYYKNKFDI